MEGINLAAARDTAHIDHSKVVGQILALAILGVGAFAAQDSSPLGPKVLLQPNQFAALVQGVLGVIYHDPLAG